MCILVSFSYSTAKIKGALRAMDKKKIRIALIEHDLTHEKLAELFDCKRALVSHSLNGIRHSHKSKKIRAFVSVLVNNRQAA